MPEVFRVHDDGIDSRESSGVLMGDKRAKAIVEVMTLRCRLCGLEVRAFVWSWQKNRPFCACPDVNGNTDMVPRGRLHVYGEKKR